MRFDEIAGAGRVTASHGVPNGILDHPLFSKPGTGPLVEFGHAVVADLYGQAMPEEFVEERMQAVPARLIPALLHVEIAPRQLLKYLLGIGRRDAIAERATQTSADTVDN